MTISITITNDDLDPLRHIEVNTPTGTKWAGPQESISTYLWVDKPITIREVHNVPNSKSSI